MFCIEGNALQENGSGRSCVSNVFFSAHPESVAQTIHSSRGRWKLRTTWTTCAHCPGPNGSNGDPDARVQTTPREAQAKVEDLGI